MENKKNNKFWILFIAIFLTQLYLVSAITITSVNTNPDEVQPGGKFTLNLKIENNLEENADNVVVSLILNEIRIPTTGQIISTAVPFAPYQSSNEVRIDTIESDDHETASFDLIVFPNAVSGTYNLPVKINYDLSDGTSEPEEDFLVSVIVNAKPNIDVSSEGEALIRGMNGKISIKIVNSGLGDAQFLNINLNPVLGMQITSTNKVYIGNIDSNDFDTADFNVFINADASSSISLPVQLTYTDSRNNQITENKVILIKTYTAKEATDLGLIGKNNTFAIIVSIVGALILFFIYRRIRKRNRNKRNGQ